MNLFLYEEYTLKTKLNKKEIISRLNDNIDLRNYFKRHYSGDKQYEGEIVGNNFEMKVISPGRNPFKAVIEGSIMNSEETRIKIILKMYEIGIVFSSFIGIIALTLTYIFLKDVFKHSIQKDEQLGVIIFILLYCFCIGIYKFQANYMKTFIKNLFEAEKVK